MSSDVFLPQRQAVPSNFLEGQCNGTSIAGVGTDVGGGAVDAAN